MEVTFGEVVGMTQLNGHKPIKVKNCKVGGEQASHATPLDIHQRRAAAPSLAPRERVAACGGHAPGPASHEAFARVCAHLTPPRSLTRSSWTWTRRRTAPTRAGASSRSTSRPRRSGGRERLGGREPRHAGRSGGGLGRWAGPSTLARERARERRGTQRGEGHGAASLPHS